MDFIDLHADTIVGLYYEPGKITPDSEFTNASPISNLAENKLCIDVNKLKSANSLAQFFVLWLNFGTCKKLNIDPWEHFSKLHTTLVNQVALNQDSLKIVTNHEQLMNAKSQNKIGAFISIEEGVPITSLDKLEEAYNMGVRYITLVWNYETHIGMPGKLDQTVGLTKFGKELVNAMQHLGVMVDISHLSDQGVKDVIDIAKKPIIASHSNARSLCNHTRNLPDELIRKVANTGGVIGVTFVPKFLSTQKKHIDIADIVSHAKHIHKLGGEDVLAIGTDFDGFFPEEPHLDHIKSIADVPKLIQALGKAGFKTTQIEKLFSRNFLRVLQHIEA